jgi:FkbM family methyltransferase
LSPLFTIKLDGYDLRFYPTNVSANLWINPASRFHDLSLFTDYCRPDDVVVDVGANIGEVSIVFSRRVGAGGQVFAFEPHPRIFQYLQGNLALNHCGNVTSRNIAVGSAPGTVHMSDDKRDDMNRITPAGIAVRCSTLDAELPAVPIALLKVDVEGSELSVLKGGSGVLSRTACVNCELIDEHCRRYGHAMGDVIAWLQQAGFETFVTSGTRQLRRVTASFAEPGAHELVAVRDLPDFTTRTGWQVL